MSSNYCLPLDYVILFTGVSLVAFLACSLIISIIRSLESSNAMNLVSPVISFLMWSQSSLTVSSAQFILGLPTLLPLCVHFLNLFPLKVMLWIRLLGLLIILHALFLFSLLYASTNGTTFFSFLRLFCSLIARFVLSKMLWLLFSLSM
jgi:hypothetical protein